MKWGLGDGGILLLTKAIQNTWDGDASWMGF